ncbi:MAG: ATP-binding protein, partial [Bacillota bacterium]
NSELFYLKKSSHALEHIMEISYSLYENLEDGKDKEKALNLSKNIHEIKKDYRRVIEGINYNIKKTSEYKLTFKQLISIVEKNSKKMIFNLEKDIDLKFFIQKDFVIKNYYSFLTIINNLIINSIESIEEEGIISLNQKMTKDYLYIEVKDNGPGILKKDLEVIFNSGFTTKYDKETGKMSSGIGLNHVRNIVNNVFNGEIKVDSVVDEYTLFTVKIPRDNLGG